MTRIADDIEPYDSGRAEPLAQDSADLLAMSYGFKDAAEMKLEGERMEREYLAATSNKGSGE